MPPCLGASGIVENNASKWHFHKTIIRFQFAFLIVVHECSWLASREVWMLASQLIFAVGVTAKGNLLRLQGRIAVVSQSNLYANVDYTLPATVTPPLH